jgi:hypothetical protein
MSGWIKLEKGLREDRRFTRIVDALLMRSEQSVSSVTQMRFIERNAVTQVLGGLAQLWMFADSHIREDDTLDITLDEIDQLVGIEGFAELMPADWLEVLNENSVRLPDFQAHNGTDAKKKALTSKRVQRHRIRNAVSDVTPEKRTGVTGALPDQTRPDQTRPDQTRPDQTRPDQTRPEKKVPSVPPAATQPVQSPEFDDLRAIFPKRAGSQPWDRAQKAINARLHEGHSWSEILDGARRYAAFIRATGKERTESVLQAATFVGPSKHFLNPYELPATKADARLAGNLSAADEFMRRTEVTQ